MEPQLWSQAAWVPSWFPVAWGSLSLSPSPAPSPGVPSLGEQESLPQRLGAGPLTPSQQAPPQFPVTPLA